MTSYKIKWECKSPFSTPLQSDTIFGHLAWAFQYIKGGVFLQDLIAELKEKPSLVLSSAFPEGKLPLPALPFPYDIDHKVENYDQYRKILKKITFFDIVYFSTNNYTFDWVSFITMVINNIIKSKDKVSFQCCLEEQPQCISCSSVKVKKEENRKKEPKQELIFHNTINRLTGTTTENSLYATETTYTDECVVFESYIQLDSQIVSEQDLRQSFDYIRYGGFGKDKSTGKGRFEISMEPYEFPLVKDANAYLSLSNMVPSPSDPIKAFYKGFTKFGKLGGDLVLKLTPFKYPIFMFEPGAVFFGNKPIGSLLTDIHPDSKELNIVQNLYSYSIPFVCSEVIS